MTRYSAHATLRTVTTHSHVIRLDSPNPAPAGAGEVLRMDRGGGMARVERTPQGGIRVDAYLTRPGIFEYLNPDGTVRREYRPPEEVFKADSLATLLDAPVTDDHPWSEPGQLVTPANFRRLARGQARDIRQDGDKVAGLLTIQDQDLLGKVEKKEVREISCGYRCRMDMTPGTTPEGERYDAVQRDIRYNHVAVVPRGRAGSDVALRLDAAGNVRPPGGHGDNPQEDRRMESIRIDGVEYPLGTEADRRAAIAAMARFQAKLDAAEATRVAELGKLQARADAAEANVKGLQGKLEEALDPKRLDAAVQVQVKVRADAARILGAEEAVKLDGQPVAAVQAAVIAKVFPTIKLDGKSPEYIAAMYDAATARADAAQAADPNGHGNVRQALSPHQPTTRQDSAAKPADPADSEAARQRMDSANRTAWTQPLAYSKDQPAKA